MNCIGGFLINYTDSLPKSKMVFNYFIENFLEKYFLNNFAYLKQLLYVSEKIVQKYAPKFHSHLKSLQIQNEYWISPILLTLFTNGL